MSEPLASVEVPAARLAADPPEEPPGVISRFQGLRVTPHKREWVWKSRQNSGVVLDCNRQPFEWASGAFRVALLRFGGFLESLVEVPIRESVDARLDFLGAGDQRVQ